MADVSEIAVVVMMSLIVFHLVLGRKVSSLAPTLESDIGEEGEGAANRALGTASA